MDEARGGEDPAFQTDHFRIYEYKVKKCTRSRPHDWTQCCFAHNGEKAKRRDPRKFAYTGAVCPDYRKSASCRRGDQCPFSHGVFESWLHPSRYRTQCCTDGLACKRRVCFFAHQESELRKPEDDPEVLAAQLQAEAIASQESYQQILAAASLESVPEALPASHAPPQLNVALIQALLQSINGAAGMANGGGGMPGYSEAEAQDRSRMYQLQTLLAALQMRTPPPPQPASPQQDALGSLDTAALGRLLAANQALVQQQAEAEILQRSSFEASRRNSMSSSPNGFGGGSAAMDALLASSAFARQQSEGARVPPHGRRMSLDTLGASYSPAHLQASMDPRVLAALAATPQRGGNAEQQQQQAAANEAYYRRSVDLGSLAHSGARPSYVNAFAADGDKEPGGGGNAAVQRQDSAQLLGMLQAQQSSQDAFAAGFSAAAQQMELQGSGQLPGRRSFGGELSGFSGQLSGQGSGHMNGGFRQLPQGSFPGPFGHQLQAQGSGHLSNGGYGPSQQQQYGAGFSPADRVSLSSASSSQGHMSEPFASSAWPADAYCSKGTSLGSEDDRQAALPLLAQQRYCSKNTSLGSEDDRQAALPLLSQQRAGSPQEHLPLPEGAAYSGCMKPPASSYELGLRTPTTHNMALPFLQPSPIPEDQPAPWLGQQHLPPPSTCAAQAHARQMPTLLEQLQMYEAQRARGMAAASQLPPFDARRGGGGQQQHAQQQLIARNTSFESLSADLPRSISDLNLADHHINSLGVPATST